MRFLQATMKRGTIGIVAILMFGLLAVLLPANAQEPGVVYRIGWLGPEPSERKSYFEPFLGQLRDLGWVEGKHFVMEYQTAPRKQFYKRVRTLATELVRLNVDVIVVISTPGALAVKEATATIPIVMGGSSRPVARGLIESLARPGGNVTGLTNNPGEGFFGKMLQLLKEAAPGISHVAILRNPLAPDEDKERWLKWYQTVVQEVGLTPLVAIVQDASEYADAFAMFTQEHADALFVTPTILNSKYRKRILDFATTHRLPTISGVTSFVNDGGLMSYWTRWSELRRRSAIFVDKILKGGNPAELPVERPTKFDLLINLKTAKALGLTIPPTLLLQATEVIR